MPIATSHDRLVKMAVQTLSFYFRVAFAILLLQTITVLSVCAEAGCSSQAVGISDSHVIPDNRFSATTIYDSRYHPYYARLNGSPGWDRKSSDTSGYLQIDLNAVFMVCAVATQGASYGTEWVKSYKVQFSIDNQAWSTYRETAGTDKVFNGNTDGTTVVKNTLAVPTMARFIRFVPLSHNRDPTMRVEVYGTKPDVCKSSLGLMDDVIPDSAMSASSGSPSAARLYGNSSWCSTSSSVSEYLQVDLGGVRTVSGVATQGSPGEEKWVKTYNLQYSGDGTRWLTYDAATSNDFSFTGNVSKNLAMINWLSHPIRARYVRIKPLTWNSAICLRADLFGDIECSCESLALGLGDNRVPSASISASSNNANAVRARLGTASGAWCASLGDVSPYLQVDLGSSHMICAVATQGDSSADQWVQTYRIDYSDDEANWTSYRENNTTRKFNGNYDRNSIVRQVLYQAPAARYVRVVPISETGSKCLRLELYGHRLGSDCQSHAVGLQSTNMIPDHRFTSNSWYSSGYYPWYARLQTSKAWTPKAADRDNTYLQVDLGGLWRVCSVASQGAYSHWEWTKQYAIAHSVNNISWTPYNESGVQRVFTGNTDKSSVVVRLLAHPPLARFIRFVPTAYENYPTTRLDYRGLQSACASSLGVERGYILDSQMTSSSNDGAYTASAGRLYGGSSWCSSTSANNEYLQVDLGGVKTVTGVATQGSRTQSKWVTRYVIKYSFTGTEWSDVKDGGSIPRIFDGNEDHKTGRVNWFEVPIAAQFIRVHPQAVNSGNACMRIDFYGCTFVFLPGFKSQREITLQASNGTRVSVPCPINGQPQPVDFKWYKNDTFMAGDTSSSITVTYRSAADVKHSYKCVHPDPNHRPVKCVQSYACSARYPLTLPSAGTARRAEIKVSVQLNVLAAPVVDVTRNKRSLTLQLTSSADDSTGPLTGYTVKNRTSGAWTTREIGSSSQYELTGLVPYTSYTVQARGKSVVGLGLWSAAGSYTTLMADPDGKLIISQSTAATSSTAIQIQWTLSSDYRLNGQFKEYIVLYEYMASNGSNIIKSEKVTNINTQDLSLSPLKKFTNYTLTLRSSNTQYTGATSDARIVQTWEDAPDCPPSSSNFKAMTSTSIRVTWSTLPETCTNGIVRKYVISYHKDGGSNETTEVPTTSFEINNLAKYTKYTIKVRGYTVKEGPWSTPGVARTKPDVPEGIPTISTIAPGSSTSVNLTWTFTATDKIYGEFQGFNITYKEEGGGTLYKTTNHTTRSCIITGLKKFTYYEVSVSVRNHVFNGPFSTTRRVRTDEDVPSAPPLGVNHTEINSTTFNISWNPIPKDQSNGIITSYDLELSSGQARRRRRSLTESLNSTLTYIVLHNLESCTIYHLRVRARTRKGPGPYSPQYTLQTSPPGTPTDLKATDETKTSVLLRWRPPNFIGSIRYTVMYKGFKPYWPEWNGHFGKVTTSSQSVTPKNLIPGTKYIFNITSSTKCGDSKTLNFKVVTTKVANPVAPVVPLGRISRDTNVTLWKADEVNGPIDSYQVMVLKEKPDNVNLTEIQAEELCKEDEEKNKKRNYYIAAEVEALSMNQTIIIGDGRIYKGRRQKYKNKALDEGSKNKVYIRAMTYLNEEVEPLCGVVALAGVIEIPVASSKNLASTTSSPVGAIAGGVVALLILAAFVAAVVLFIRRRNDNSPMRKPAMQMESFNEGQAESNADIADEGISNQQEAAEAANTERIYDNAVDDLSKPIPIALFPEYVAKMQANGGIRLETEYKKFDNGQQFPWEAARKPANKNKNRYANIVAYDHSRVVLERVNGDEDSDYINASFIHGYDGTPRSFIASQGPLPPAFEGFWRMVWEQNSQSIVMLTNLVELGKTKCHKYWPDKTETYGGVTVTLHQSEIFADYEIRTFILSKAKRSGSRMVRQFHFTVWPDKGVPQYATAVLAFRRKVRALNPRDAGPVIVHCSAGVGRTGAYIVIDAMLEQAKKSRTVDIRNYLIALRKDRPHMVQTKEQYSFIHSAVLEALTCGNTEIQSENYNQAMQKLASVNRKFQMTGYALEFQRLNSVTSREIPAEEKSVGEKPQNLHKNRFSDIIALNSCRVMLHKEHADEESDYINAVFLHAHRERNAFIATQHPLQHTIEDFWRMVTDYDIGTIVMLNNLHEHDQEYPQYLPVEGATKYGHIRVSLLSKQEKGDVISTKLKVTRNKKTHEVRHLHHVSWPDKCIPEVARSVLDLLDEVQASQQQCGNAPVLVQCSNGVGRSGTFCAISSVIERLKTEQVIDVFQVIKRIRANRPGAVESLTQYVFCYQIIQKYLDSFSDYANFSDC
ncbi:receptor-type tyrosine-protein phosphatase S isoform X3 [Nematostella vectensis]|uniref:receptor-type tyrosine-protein phosphatase S isoform X3 n=1 Tax=Nematostella vectensis TaxID=45351 RepID=UPI0020778652|nr:receptor-type tyrosine-protein phosphatase S isoform X3 [Nematostella vectensis]